MRLDPAHAAYLGARTTELKTTALRLHRDKGMVNAV